MQMIELFTGCGGLAKGMERAGFSHVAFVENNSHACETLRLNFPPEIVHEVDIRSFDFSRFGSVEAIAGGPPCQPFSLGGLAKAHKDHRDMFPEATRAITELAPRGFIFENVKGLLRQSFSEYFQYIILRLTYPTFHKADGEHWKEHLARLQSLSYQNYTGLKYQVQYKLLNSADYGVPQVRERVFIVGLRDDVATPWNWPKPTHARSNWKTIREALAGLPDPQDRRNTLSDHVFVPGAKPYPGHVGSPIDRPSKTIKAGAHGVPGGENMILFEDGTVRYFTVHEAKIIQTFPSDYSISGPWTEAMRQIGNAVPVRLAEILGRQLFKILSASTTDSEPIRYRSDSSGNLLLVERSRKHARDAFYSHSEASTASDVCSSY
ncbi:MAG: DNA cytosine methyltransferase [Kiritimatiellia bacterium]|jgi:DNA (cytosine-5)-methyltransferase 1